MFQGFQVAFLPRNSILLHPPLHSSKPLPFLSLSRFTSAFMMIKIQNLEPTDHFKWKYLIYWFFALIFSCIIFWFNSFPCSEAYHILYTLIQLHILSLTNKIKNQNKQTKKKKIPKQNNTETPKHTKRHAINFVLSSTTTTYNGVCLVVWLIYTGCSWKILFSLSYVQ